MNSKDKNYPAWWIYNPEPEGQAYPPQLDVSPPWLEESGDAKKGQGSAASSRKDEKSPARFRNFYLDPEDDKQALDLINAALYLRKPMLIKGKPGVGKSSLAYSIAYKLNLGEVLRWNITSQTTIKDGLYKYDAIGYAADTFTGKPQIDEKPRPVFHLKALGSAIANFNPWPAVLLIDEIDKSDMDLPNDLLAVLDEGRFRIDEWVKKGIVRDIFDNKIEMETDGRGWIKYKRFPIIIMTTNEERLLPAAFLRRCMTIEFKDPKQKKLEIIVKKHFLAQFECGRLDEKTIEGFVSTFLEKYKENTPDALLGAVQLYISELKEDEQALKSLLDIYYGSLKTGNGK